MSLMVLPGIGVRKETCQPGDLSNKGDCIALGAWHLEAETGFASQVFTSCDLVQAI